MEIPIIGTIIPDDKLGNKIIFQKEMTNSKKKGNLFENRFAKFLRASGLDRTAGRNTGSGGGQLKADILSALRMHFEVKAGKNISLKKAWDQAMKDSMKAGGMHVPVVAMHYDGMAEDEFFIVMNNHDWAELVKQAAEPKILEGDLNREQKYKVKMLKNLAHDVYKILDGKK